MDDSTYQEIRKLKPEYGIGTQDIWRFLVAERAYENLWEELSDLTSKENIPFPATPRNIANLCNYAQSFVSFAIEIEGKKLGILFQNEPKNVSIYPYDEPSRRSESHFDNLVSLDYREFGLRYYFHLATYIFRDAIRKTILEVMNGSHPYIEDNGNQYTFKSFCTMDHLLDTQMPLISYDELEEEYPGISLGDPLIPEFEAFIEGLPSKMYPKIRLEGMTAQEMNFLLGQGIGQKNLYDRALRDRTLRDVHVSRKIGLQYLRSCCDYFPTPEDVYYRTLLALQKGNIATRQHLEKFISIQAPAVIIENTKDSIEETSYLIWTLTANKKWLLNMLQTYCS